MSKKKEKSIKEQLDESNLSYVLLSIPETTNKLEIHVDIGADMPVSLILLKSFLVMLMEESKVSPTTLLNYVADVLEKEIQYKTLYINLKKEK